MKKILLATLFVSHIGNAQIINFPDANFKANLLASNSSNNIAKDLNGNSFKIDANNDNQIDVSEALMVKELQPNPFESPTFNYESIVGILYFTNMETFNLGASNTTAIDVSGLINLKFLYFRNCPVSTLDVTNCSALEEIVTSSANLTSVDLSTLVNLRIFSAPICPITELDLSHNMHLDILDLMHCEALVSLNIRNGSIESQRNLYECYNLQYVCCDDDEYDSVQMLMNYIPISNAGLTTNCDLSTVESDILSSIKPYPNPVSDYLYFANISKIYRVECYTIDGRLLRTIEGKSVNQINVSDLTSGVYIVKVNSDNGSSNFKIIKE